MKGCIVLQRQFAVMGNAIASELKNKYNVDEFCGYIVTRRAEKFVKSQKNINYTDLILYEGIHDLYKEEKLDLDYLKTLEAEYGLPNLWPYIIPDRSLMMDIPRKEYKMSPTPKYSHEDMLRIMQSYFRYTIKFLNKEKPNFIAGVNVGSIGTVILYHVSKKMGIKNYTIENVRLGNHVTFSDDYRILSGVKKIFKDIRENSYKSPFKKKAEQFLENFRRSPVPPDYAKEEKQKGRTEKILAVPRRIIVGLKFTLKSFIEYLKNPHKSDLTVENPILVLVHKLRRQIRGLRNLDKYYDKIDYGEDFAFFPLHYEPEIATLLYAPFYANQLNLISQIAKSLPVHFKLYVKEHPAMLEYRPTEYYKELKKIPNVKLVPIGTSSFDLMKHAKIVTVITGTAGLESIFLKRPVITFGEVFFNEVSMVKRCGAIEDLPALIKEQLTHFKYDEEEVLDYVSAIFEDSVSFDFMDIWVKGGSYEQIKANPMFPKFVENLTKKIGLTKRVEN